MINANELRIGNWVYEEGEKLTQIIVGWQLDEGMEIFPIPLTEEWLLRFGFENEDENGDCFLNDVWNIWNEGELGFEFIINGSCGPYLNYVHQLQNLYYALTQTELELKK